MTSALAALALLAPGSAPTVGDKLAPFIVRTVQAQPYAWKPGRLTVITFCAFWCDTWKTQVPRLQEAERSLAGLPVSFLTISVDGRWTELAKPRGWTLLADPGARWSSRLGIDRIPYTLVVDKSGAVRWAKYGVIRSADLSEGVRQALKPASATDPVYLTFDDFPSKAYDDELLDVLRRERVRATFFCIGQNVSGRERVVKRAAREGHSLQLHSWSHDRKRPDHTQSLSAFARLGMRPTLYRAPGSQDIVRLGGGTVKKTTLAAFDFQRPGAKELVRRVLLGVRPGIVIQLHTGVSDTVEALPEIIRGLKGRGLSLAVLE